MTISEAARKYEMLVRVRDFSKAHADRFPKSSMGSEAFKAIDAALDKLNQHVAVQVSSRSASGSGGSTGTAAYRELVAMLNAISLTAKAVALDVPGADDRFRLPKSGGKLATVDAARAFALNAESIARAFIAHGMPRDFVAQLAAKIEAFEQTLHEREAAREQTASARTSMNDALQSGLAAVQRLDALVNNVLSDDSALMAKWQVARRVERWVSRKAADAAPPATTEPESKPVAAVPPATTVPAAPSPAPQAN